MQLLQESNTSFSAGANDSAPPLGFRPDEAALLVNYRVTPAGDAEVRSGSQRTHSAALNSGAQGYGLFSFVTAAGVDQLVTFAGDSAYYSTDEGVTWTLIASGLRQDYWSGTTFRNAAGTTSYLLLANGSTTMYSWDGSAWATVTGPASGMKVVAVHNERVWASDGSVWLYGSAIRDHTVWSTTNGGVQRQVLTHGGDNGITALFSLGPWLLLFKRDSMAYLEGYGSGDLIVAAGDHGISRDVGCIAPRSLVGVGGAGVVFLSRRGFEFFQPGGPPTLVSRSLSSWLADINWSDIEATPNLPCAYWYPNKLTYECKLPGTANVNDTTFVYRIPVGEQPGACSYFDSASSSGVNVEIDANNVLQAGTGTGRLRTQGGVLQVVTGSTPGVYADLTGNVLNLATNNTVSAAVASADRGTEAQRPVGIGYDGYVRNLDSGTLDDVTSGGSGGNAINDRLKTRPFVFGDPSRRKRGRIVRVLATASGEITPSVTLVSDGTSGTTHTLTFPASAGDLPVGKRARVSGRGRVLQAEVSGAGAGTRISGVFIEAEPLREVP